MAPISPLNLPVFSSVFTPTVYVPCLLLCHQRRWDWLPHRRHCQDSITHCPGFHFLASCRRQSVRPLAWFLHVWRVDWDGVSGDVVCTLLQDHVDWKSMLQEGCLVSGEFIVKEHVLSTGVAQFIFVSRLYARLLIRLHSQLILAIEVV